MADAKDPSQAHTDRTTILDSPTDRVFYIGQVEVPEGTWVHPGETRDLVITFLNVRGLAELLQVGRTWRIQEGGKHVATAQVLELLDET